MKKTLLILCAAAALIACSAAVAVKARRVYVTHTVQDAGHTAQAAISEKKPDESAASGSSDLEVVEIGRDAEGLRAEALFRFELPAGIAAESVQKAYFCIRWLEGGAPELRAAQITQSWNTFTATWNETAALISPENQSPVSENAGDGWYKIDITALVKDWLAGKSANHGFAVAETRNGQRATFASIETAQAELVPKLEIRCTPARNAGKRYGQYAFEAQEEGNCLSYALRDRDMILFDDLFPDPGVFQAVYDAGGMDASLAYVKEQVLRYVEQHKAALGIESIRELDGLDAKIDPKTEYVIALRIGFRDRRGSDGIQVEEDFDFHFWVRLSDGSWAEKTPGEAARLVPGSNVRTDPGQYPWHQGYMWGYEKWNDYYTSGTVYFAVQKSADGFTDHRK